jgi:hypothetical protein
MNNTTEPPAELTTVAIVEAIRAAALSFQNRQMFWPPEMWEMPCDLHEQWAREWLEANLDYTTALLKHSTQKDFDCLLGEVFKSDIWNANRRAFFGALHKLAIEHEVDGGTASPALVAFYRARYNPPHRFQSERPVVAGPVHRDPLFIPPPPFFQKPGEISDDDE